MKKYLIILLALLSFNLYSQETNTGLIFTEPDNYEKIGVASLPFGAGEIPRQVDLSSDMPPVGNQNPQNSCVAWATTYACLSYYEKGIRNKPYFSNGQINYDNILSPSYVYNQINNGQNKGTYFEDAFKILQDEGACSFSSMPYIPNDWVSQPNTNQENEARNFKIETYRRLNLSDAVTSLKAELINKNPIIIASVFDETYYNSGFNFSGSDYKWNSIGNVNNFMGHAILIVGFDDNKNAFKIMNSWGKNWGNDGYGWINYNIINQAVREAYIIKPKYKENLISEETPEYITTTSNELNNNDKNSVGLNFSVTNVTHQNSFNSPAIPAHMRQMGFNGSLILPSNIGNNAQIVINFYVDNSGVKGALIGSNNISNSLPNGQAAAGTPILNLIPNQNTNTTFWCTIPYSSLIIPRGRWNQTPFGPKYQSVTSHLIAEPVLFIDNFPMRTGQLIPFTVAQ
jgi:C1A family cysteine protease